MAVRRPRRADERTGANGLLLTAMAIFTLAVLAMIAWILVSNAHEEPRSTAAVVALLLA